MSKKMSKMEIINTVWIGVCLIVGAGTIGNALAKLIIKAIS